MAEDIDLGSLADSLTSGGVNRSETSRVLEPERQKERARVEVRPSEAQPKELADRLMFGGVGGVTPLQNPEEFLTEHAKIKAGTNLTDEEWTQELAPALKSNFPGIDVEGIRKPYEQQRKMETAREQYKNAEEKPFATVARLGMPWSSRVQTIRNTKELQIAQDRFQKGDATDDDIRVIAQAERRGQLDEQNSFRNAMVSIPGMVGEAAMAGTALKGAATLPGVGKYLGFLSPTAEANMAARSAQTAFPALGGYAARTTAQTALMPAMYVDKAAQNALINGGDLTDWKNAAPAFAMGTIQTAVLQMTGGIGQNIKGAGISPALQRIAAGSKGGIVGQQVADVIGSAAGWETGYGVLGDLYRGDADKALQHAATQAATFAIFSSMHAGGNAEKGTQVLDAFKNSLKESAKDNLPPPEAAKKAIAAAQDALKETNPEAAAKLAQPPEPTAPRNPVVIEENGTRKTTFTDSKGVVHVNIEDVHTPEQRQAAIDAIVSRQRSERAAGKRTQDFIDRGPGQQTPADMGPKPTSDLDAQREAAGKGPAVVEVPLKPGTHLPSALEEAAREQQEKPFGHLPNAELRQLSSSLTGKEYTTPGGLEKELARKGMTPDKIKELSDSTKKTAKTAVEPSVPPESTQNAPPAEATQMPPEPVRTPLERSGETRTHISSYKEPSKSVSDAITMLERRGSTPRRMDTWTDEGTAQANQAKDTAAFVFDRGSWSGEGEARQGIEQLTGSKHPLPYEPSLRKVIFKGSEDSPKYQKLKETVDKINEERADAKLMKEYGHDGALQPVELKLERRVGTPEERADFEAKKNAPPVTPVNSLPDRVEQAAPKTEVPRTETPKTMLDRIRARQKGIAEGAKPVSQEKPVQAAPKVPEPEPLNDRERLVLDARREGRSLEDIGRQIGVTREWVRRIEKAALEKEGKQIGSMGEKQKLERQQARIDAIENGRTNAHVEPGDLHADPDTVKAVGERFDEVEQIERQKDKLLAELERKKNNGDPISVDEWEAYSRLHDRIAEGTRGRPQTEEEASPVIPGDREASAGQRSVNAPPEGRQPANEDQGAGQGVPVPGVTAEAPAEPAGGRQANPDLSPGEKMRRLRPVPREYEALAQQSGIDKETIHREYQDTIGQSRAQVAESNQTLKDALGNLDAMGKKQLANAKRQGFENNEEWQSITSMDRVIDYLKNRGFDEATAWDLIRQGEQKPLTEAEVYSQSLDTMIARKQAAKDAAEQAAKAKQPRPLEENDFVFGANLKDAIKDFAAEESGALNLDWLGKQVELAKGKLASGASHLKATWDEAVNQVKELAGKSFPRMTALSRAVGERMSRYDAAGKYVRAATPDYIDRVLGPEASDPKADLLRGTVAAEFRLRTAKVQRQEESRKASNDAADARQRAAAAQQKAAAFDATGNTIEANIARGEARRAMQQAADSATRATEMMIAARKQRGTFVGQIAEGQTEPAIATDADYYRELNSKEQQDFHQRWKDKFVDVEMEPNQRLARGMGDDEPIRSVTQVPGLPFNFKAVTSEADVKPGVTFLSTGGRGNLKNVKTGKFVFGKEAGLDADAYDTRVSSMVENSLAKGYPNAKKADFYRTGLAEGTLKPEPAEGFKEVELANWPERTLDPVKTAEKGEDVYLDKNAKVYVKENAYGEVRRMLKLDEPVTLGPITAAANAVTSISLFAQITEAASHVGNQITQLFNPRMNWFKYGKNVWDLYWGDPATQARFLDLVKMGATKEGGFESLKGESSTLIGRGLEALGVKNGQRYDPFTWIGKALDLSDKAIRLTSTSAFDSMVEGRSKLNPLRMLFGKGEGVPDTETNRRDFINQVGNYSKQAQAKIVAILRDTGIAPFATAGTNYWMQGQRALTFNPGVETKGWKQQAELRAEKFMRIAGVAGGVALANYLAWGNVFGDDNTPIGSIKIGTDEGRTKFFDVLAFTGWTRGARQIGARALMEGERRDTEGNKIENNAATDAWHGLLHPISGPLINFSHTAMTGEDFMGKKLTPKVGETQGDRWMAAVKNINPTAAGVLGADTPGKDLPATERIAKALGRFGFKYREGNESSVDNFYDKWKDIQQRHAEATKQVRMGLRVNSGPVQVEYERVRPYYDEITKIQQQLKGEQMGGRGIVPEPAQREVLRQRMAVLAKRALNSLPK